MPQAVNTPRRRRSPQPVEVLKVPEARLTESTVSLVTGMSASSIARKVASGDFPSPIHDGPRCKRWICGDVLAWLDTAPSKGAQ